MLYAILAYHVEGVVAAWSADEDAALMVELKGPCKADDEKPVRETTYSVTTPEGTTTRTK